MVTKTLVRCQPKTIVYFAFIFICLLAPNYLKGQQNDSDKNKTEELTEVNSKEGGFVVKQFSRMEQKVVEVKLPDKDDNGEKTPQGKVEVHMFMSQSADENVAMVTAFHDLKEKPSTDEEKKKVLDGAVVGAVNSVQGKASKHTELKLSNYPGRQVEYSAKRFGTEIKGVSRIFVRDNRVYQINYVAESENFDKAQAEEYFSSFKFVAIVEEDKESKEDKSDK